MFQLQVEAFSFSSLSASCRRLRFQFKLLNRLSVYDFEIRIDFFITVPTSLSLTVTFCIQRGK